MYLTGMMMKLEVHRKRKLQARDRQDDMATVHWSFQLASISPSRRVGWAKQRLLSLTSIFSVTKSMNETKMSCKIDFASKYISNSYLVI